LLRTGWAFEKIWKRMLLFGKYPLMINTTCDKITMVGSVHWALPPDGNPTPAEYISPENGNSAAPSVFQGKMLMASFEYV